MSVATIALATEDIVEDGKYDMNSIILESVMIDMGLDDVEQACDEERVLDELRKMSGDDWQRVLHLVMYWWLDDLMGDGYFLDD